MSTVRVIGLLSALTVGINWSLRGENSLRSSNRHLVYIPRRRSRRRVLYNTRPPRVPLYTPLDPAGDCIRLLLVRPGEFSEEIDCSLSVVSLALNPSYTALSYTWGPPIRRSASLWTWRGVYQFLREWYERVRPTKTTIVIDGRRISVTPNLKSALQYLRKSDMPLKIWVDAVCIDQENNSEKEHQVSLMGKIYVQARRTYVWLGLAADSSDVAMDYVAAMHNLDVLAPSFKLTQISPPSSALNALFSRSWWSRVWVVQEAMLSHNLIVKCGHKEVPFESFSRFAKHEHLLRQRLRTEPQFGSSHFHQGRWTFISPHVPFFSLLYVWHLLRKDSPPSMIASDGMLPLSDIIRGFSPLSSTLARDRIYSTLGLCTPTDRAAISIDYTGRKTDGEVFREVAAHIIKSTNVLDTLGWGRQVSDERVGDLPSWAPDYSSPEVNYWSLNKMGFNAGDRDNKRGWVPLTHPIFNQLPPVATSLFLKFSDLFQIYVQRFVDIPEPNVIATFSENNTVLTVRGILVDTVSFADPSNIPPIRQWKYDPDSNILFAYSSVGERIVRKFKRWESELSQRHSHSNPYHTPEGRYTAFWRTVICNRMRDKEKFVVPPPNMRYAYETYVGKHWHLQTDGRWLQKMNNLIGRFSGSMANAASGRAFIITDSGFLGMAPDVTRRGDVVCVVRGSTVPFIIRAKGEGRWELIGECYVHGIMDGETLREVKSGHVRKLHFV